MERERERERGGGEGGDNFLLNTVVLSRVTHSKITTV